VVLQKVKKSNVDKPALKELIFGGVQELMRNRKYYYHSGVGASYSHWTEQGKDALAEYMNMMGWMILEAENKELDARAKSIVLNTLKGESTTSEQK